MTHLLRWLFGSPKVKVTAAELCQVRCELDEAVDAQKDVRRMVDGGVRDSEKLSRSLQALTQALNLAADKKDEQQ